MSFSRPIQWYHSHADIILPYHTVPLRHKPLCIQKQFIHLSFLSSSQVLSRLKNIYKKLITFLRYRLGVAKLHSAALVSIYEDFLA